MLPNVPIDGICRRLVMVWTLWPNALPVYRLGICLVLQGLGVCHRASLEGGQHLGMPCLFPSLPRLGLGLPLLFSIIKGIGGYLDHLILRQQSPAAVAIVTLSLCLMYTGTGISPLKSPVSCRSLSPDW